MFDDENDMIPLEKYICFELKVYMIPTKSHMSI